MHAFHLSAPEHGLSNIRKRRLKVTRFSETNDPFELFALNCYEYKHHRNTLQAFKTETDATLGLLCFSRQWKKPVLWSHYAEGHRGICLGFDIRSTLGVGGVQRVEYRSDKLKLLPDDRNRADIPEEIKKRLHVTKSIDWRYEDEVRVLIRLAEAQQADGHYFWPFSQDLKLTDVVLGERCPMNLASVRAAVRESSEDARVSRAKLSIKYFHVKEDDRAHS